MFLTKLDKLTPVQRMQRLNSELFDHQVTSAYTGVIMYGKYEMTTRVGTACTDGINTYYNPDWFFALSEPEQRAVIMHETLHKLLQQLFIWKDLFEANPLIANIASDYVVNGYIDEMARKSAGFLRLPGSALLDAKYAGMDTKQVFDLLVAEAKQNGGSGGSKMGTPLDDHDWSAAKNTPTEEVEQIRSDLDAALRSGKFVSSKTGRGGSDMLIDKLLAPKIDWRKQLREFVTSVTTGGDLSTWARPNRRWMQHDIYLPSTYSETVGPVLLGVDTSGSISTDALREGMSEVAGILKAVDMTRVDLVYWGSCVVGHEVYGKDQLRNLLSVTKPKSGGGTNAAVIPEYLKANKLKPSCAIIFTDGLIPSSSWGTWPCPVLWCIINSRPIVAPVGKTIHLK